MRSTFLDCSKWSGNAQPEYKEGIAFGFASFLSSSPIPFPADNYNGPFLCFSGKYLSRTQHQESAGALSQGVPLAPSSQPGDDQGLPLASPNVFHHLQTFWPTINLTTVRVFNSQVFRGIKWAEQVGKRPSSQIQKRLFSNPIFKFKTQDSKFCFSNSNFLHLIFYVTSSLYISASSNVKNHTDWVA